MPSVLAVVFALKASAAVCVLIAWANYRRRRRGAVLVGGGGFERDWAVAAIGVALMIEAALIGAAVFL